MSKKKIAPKYPELLKRLYYLPSSKSCKHDWSEMIKRHDDGESVTQIAKNMGCSYSTVRNVVRYVLRPMPTMRVIKVEYYKTKVYDAIIHVGDDEAGSMDTSVTMEELKEIVRQSKEVLKEEKE